TYSHGTLMFDVDLTVLDKVLTVSKEKIESKATKSVRKSVTNVKPFLDDAYQNLTTEAFGEALLRHVYQVDSIKDIADKELILSQEQKEGIEELFEKRYANDEWVYRSEEGRGGKEWCV